MEALDKTLARQQQLRPEKVLHFSIGAILCLVIISGVLFFFWNKDLMDYLPETSLCPFHAITGKPCPGCGMSRAFLLLGQLKIKEALEMNLFSVPLLLLMIVYFTLGHIPSLLQNKYLVHISLFAVLAFWAVRLFSA
jgi:hypothetical protein